MPTYSYRCSICRKQEDAIRSVDERNAGPTCCNGWHMRRILTAPMVCVRQEVNYEAPSGRKITSWAQHQEELARTNSILYEPGIKQDQERNQRRRNEELERKVDETVEREIAAMPSRKLEKLGAELEAGLTAEPVRGTAPLKPITQTLER